MKVRDLKKKLKALGFSLLRQGAEHEIWSNGSRTVSVPRHREVKENTAAKILKDAGG